MNRTRLVAAASIAIALLAACGKSTPAPAPAVASTPAPTPSPAADPADPDDIGAAKYAVCTGQGGKPEQRAPAFLDQMAACEGADTTPVDKLAELGGDGKIIEGKGDCQYGGGISCHFHTSMEFVTSTKLKDDAHAVGEMHCIVPAADTNSPTVYGAHLRCKEGTSLAQGEASCTKALLGALVAANCKGGWKCCDNGTLTKPVGKQSDGEKKLRPDFRICGDDTIEIDCALLHGMHGHTANVVGLGEEFTGKFAAEHGEHHDEH